MLCTSLFLLALPAKIFSVSTVAAREQRKGRLEAFSICGSSFHLERTNMSSVSNAENLAPQVLRQVAKEVSELQSSPPEGIKLFINDGDITDIQASIEGPAGTPYEGGVFKMKLVLGKDFPAGPPKGFFITKIFHPNVSKSGEICVNTLKRDWKPSLGIKHILLTVKCLLIYPNPESALNEEAGKLLLEQYDDYSKQAKMMTEIYALPPKSSQIAGGKLDCAKDALTSTENICMNKKRPAEKSDKKKLDKKRALKRL